MDHLTEHDAKGRDCPFFKDACIASKCMMWTWVGWFHQDDPIRPTLSETKGAIYLANAKWDHENKGDELVPRERKFDDGDGIWRFDKDASYVGVPGREKSTRRRGRCCLVVPPSVTSPRTVLQPSTDDQELAAAELDIAYAPLRRLFRDYAKKKICQMTVDQPGVILATDAAGAGIRIPKTKSEFATVDYFQFLFQLLSDHAGGESPDGFEGDAPDGRLIRIDFGTRHPAGFKVLIADRVSQTHDPEGPAS